MRVSRLFICLIATAMLSCGENHSASNNDTQKAEISIPEYYIEYLNAKSQEIQKLKQNEADGFFYWTDSHYPENGGNTVAIINYLQNKVGTCLVFNGGDAAKNSDNLKTG